MNVPGIFCFITCKISFDYSGRYGGNNNRKQHTQMPSFLKRLILDEIFNAWFVAERTVARQWPLITSESAFSVRFYSQSEQIKGL